MDRIKGVEYLLHTRFIDADTGEILSSAVIERPHTIRSENTQRTCEVVGEWADAIAKYLFAADNVVLKIRVDGDSR